jgi:hypothetical protein
MAHRDRSHFGGRTSLSGHNGHGWSGGRPDPDANDPKRTFGALLREPKGDSPSRQLLHCESNNTVAHSITSSARASMVGGISKP